MVQGLFKRTTLSLKDFLLLLFFSSLLFVTILAGYNLSTYASGKYFLILSLTTSLCFFVFVYFVINRTKSIYRELNDINKYFDLALEGAYIGIWDWYLTDNSVKYDRRWAEMLGLNINEIEMSYETWQKRVHPDDLEKSLELIQAYMDGKTNRYENVHRLRHNNGQWVYILAKGRFSDWDRNGKPLRFSGTHLDITDYQNNKDLLESTSERLNLALSAARLGVWDLNLNTRNLIFDHRLLKILNLPEEKESFHVDELTPIIHPDDRANIIEQFKDAKASRKKFDIEFRTLSKNNSIRYLRAIADFKLESKRNNLERVVGIAWDITQQVLISDELKLQSKVAQHNAKLASIGQLAAGVGHEINNPLAIIKGFLTVIHKELLREPQDVTKILAFLEKTLLASDRISNIVSGLRNFSRTDQDNLFYYNIHELLVETVSLLKEIYLKEGIQLSLQTHVPKDVCLYGNRGKIQQVLINIIANAKDSVKNKPDGHIYITSQSDEKFINLKIKDNGTGIEDSVKDKIFDAFFTTKQVNEGTGIGLALAHSIIRDHEGEISFSTELNVGTEFFIKLPIPQDTQRSIAHPPAPSIEEKISSICCKAIIAEDEEDIREYLCLIFEEYGVEAISFADGQSAYDEFCKGGYDLIISDVKMPTMDGLSFLKKVRNQKVIPQPKFIFITGGVALDLQDQNKELKEAIDGYFFKPFDKQKIFNKLSTLFPKN